MITHFLLVTLSLTIVVMCFGGANGSSNLWIIIVIAVGAGIATFLILRRII